MTNEFLKTILKNQAVVLLSAPLLIICVFLRFPVYQSVNNGGINTLPESSSPPFGRRVCS